MAIYFLGLGRGPSLDAVRRNGKWGYRLVDWRGWPLADEYTPREERESLIPYSKLTLLPSKE
jgi:hypothetical protein